MEKVQKGGEKAEKIKKSTIQNVDFLRGEACSTCTAVRGGGGVSLQKP